MEVDQKVHVEFVNFNGRQCYNMLDPAICFSEFAKVNRLNRRGYGMITDIVISWSSAGSFPTCWRPAAPVTQAVAEGRMITVEESTLRKDALFLLRVKSVASPPKWAFFF